MGETHSLGQARGATGKKDLGDFVRIRLRVLRVGERAAEQGFVSACFARAAGVIPADVGHAVDMKRIAVTGFSVGGTGSWHFAAKYPERFSAAIPVAGRPPTYTKPWTVKMVQTIKLDTDLLDKIMMENEKDIKHLVK